MQYSELTLHLCCAPCSESCLARKSGLEHFTVSRGQAGDSSFLNKVEAPANLTLPFAS